jgi:high-affinity iron transporter
MRRLLRFRRPNAPAFVVAAIVMTTAALVVGSVARPSPASSQARNASPAVSPAGGIQVTERNCATGWASRTAGRTVFGIDDRTDLGGMIYLFNPFTGITVAQAVLRPHATVKLSVSLAAGRYRWNCALKGRPVLTSAQETVRQAPVLGGPAGPTIQVPVTSQQMAGAIASYRAYVTQELSLESDQVRALETAIATGQFAAARAAWLTAHLTWHRIGGAYDAFGNLGLGVDGTADRLQDGVTSPQFTGFHKVEMDLWQTDDLSAAATDTVTLLGDVNELAVQFPGESIPATELPLRTHEILEDALRDELSGDDDYGSGTDMASVEADVDGTRELLGLLAPLLDQRAPDLVDTATGQLDTLDTALAATETGGQWVTVTDVPLVPRERVDGAIGNVLETLALVPELLQVVGATT